ncbi:MAG: chemotaxis protein CheC [Methylococcales bacterium]|jgi:chemotaxis protein CheC|nr:chemotaxis protein CheC [Methylococcales bacterium]MBT7445707.1 chemotaxis protein CheC [Methylococcales bacterium]
MPEKPLLAELEEDLLGELFNIGVGQAADALSSMVEQEIKLSVPEVDFITVTELAHYLGEEDSICSVAQQMTGPFNAKSMLLFPEENSLEIVRKMLGAELPDETLVELQQETLSEIGNIVLNACIGALSRSVNEEFKVSLPVFRLAKSHELLDDTAEPNDIVLFIRINLVLSESDITGYLVFLMGSLSLQKLRDVLKVMLDNL